LPDPNPSDAYPAPSYSYVYDSVGNLLEETDPLDQTTVHLYDAHNNRIQTTYPDPDGDPTVGAQSPIMYWSYDAAGRLVQEAKEGVGGFLHRTVYTYDALDNLKSEMNANGETVDFTSDAVGNRLTLVDQKNNKTEWLYDDLNRVKEESIQIDGQSKKRLFQYDAASNLVRKTDRNGRVTEFEYDKLNRMTEERWLDSAGATIRTLSIEFDAASQLLSASDAAASYTYTHDGLGRITSVTSDLAALASNVELVSAYNGFGDRTQLKAMIGTTTDFLNDYVYDGLSRLTQVKQHGVAGGNAVADKRVDFTYDALSRFDTIKRFEDLAGAEHVATSDYGFDNAGRLASLSHKQDSTTFANYLWTYDRINRVESFSNLSYLSENAV
jgi:YD repeat-containing protein